PDLSAGSYVVRLEGQDRWPQTFAAQGYSLQATEGKSQTNQNFGIQGVAISGTVFWDGDGNKNRSRHEAGFDLWQVYLDANENRRRDKHERMVNAGYDGSWSFPDLPAGHYIVRSRQDPTLFGPRVQTMPSGGGAYLLDLSPGQTSAGNLFGVATPTSIDGTVFSDDNEDGQPNVGLAGWRVFVDENKDGIEQAREPDATTDELGRFSLLNLPPGFH